VTNQEGQREAIAKKLGMHKVDGKHEFDHRSLLATMGGWLGIAESVTPGAIFVLLLALFKNPVGAVVGAVACSVGFILVRVLRKNSLTGAIAGLLGIGIAAWLALRDGGQTKDYFVTGFITNLAYLVPLALSVLVRWPIIGVLIGFLIGEGSTWRRNRYEMRVFSAATLIWVALFGARLLVQYPLYLAGNLEILGLMRLVMGLPLYAAALWLNWLLVRGVLRRRS